MKKRKLLKNLFSKKRLFYNATGKIIDFMEKVEDIKDKIDTKKEKIVINKRHLVNKIKLTKIKIDNYKKEGFLKPKKFKWDVISNTKNKHIHKIKTKLQANESLLFINNYKVVDNILFNYNLIFNNTDISLRKFKNFSLKSIGKTGFFRLLIKENIRLLSKGLIKEKEFTNIIYDLSYLEMFFGDFKKLSEIYTSFLLNKPYTLSRNWHYYYLGRLYFFSLLKWKTEINDYTSSIRKSTIPFLLEEDKFEKEILNYMNDSRMDYLSFPDLVWGLQLSNFMVKKEGEEFKSLRNEVIDIYKVILSKNIDIINIYAKYFQYFLIQARSSFSILSFIDSIRRVNPLYSFPFEVYSGRLVENNLKEDGYDNAEFLYFSLMFNVFSKKFFFYDLSKFIRILHMFKLNDVTDFIEKLKLISPNTQKVFDYIQEEVLKVV